MAELFGFPIKLATRYDQRRAIAYGKFIYACDEFSAWQHGGDIFLIPPDFGATPTEETGCDTLGIAARKEL